MIDFLVRLIICNALLLLLNFPHQFFSLYHAFVEHINNVSNALMPLMPITISQTRNTELVMVN